MFYFNIIQVDSVIFEDAFGWLFKQDFWVCIVLLLFCELIYFSFIVILDVVVMFYVDRGIEIYFKSNIFCDLNFIIFCVIEVLR